MAAKLSHVREAENATQFKSPFPELTKEQIMESPVSVSESPNVIFKLVGKHSRRIWIDPIDDNVLNTKTGKRERIRLIRGVGTIWTSEQEKLDKEYVGRNLRSILVEDGKVVCNKIREATTIEFIRNSKHDIKNPNRPEGSKFELYEWDSIQQESEALKNEMLEVEVMQLAMDQPIEKIKRHGMFLGIRNFMVDEMGEPRTEKGMRALYVIEAKRNPKKFKESIDSKEAEVFYLVRKAIVDAKIDLGGNTGSIKWANGGFICKLPMARKAHEYLVEYAMLPNDEGKQFLENLQKNIT